jgi:hypothetical protein
MTSSNDTKSIQTSDRAPRPQPMTAALIFRRQLVRRSPLYLYKLYSGQAATRKISSAAGPSFLG